MYEYKDKKVYADYVIVYSNGYKIGREDFPISLRFNEFVCLPLRPSGALRTGCADGIEKYTFVTAKWGNERSKDIVGVRLPLVLDDSGEIKIDYDQKLNYSFYDRCRNLACVLEEFGKIVESDKDYSYMEQVLAILDSMISGRMRALFKTKNNKALELLGEDSIRKIRAKLATFKDVVATVDAMEGFEKDEFPNFEKNEREM